LGKVIEVRHLAKAFSGRMAVDDLSFDVSSGSLFAFLGQNGAGKSTTINMLVGLLAKDGGEILYDGADDFSSFKNRIGIVFQNNIFDDFLSVKENLLLYGALYSSLKDNIKSRYDELAELFSLKDFEKQRFKTLSGGQKRKSEIARALWGSPDVLFLDEPTTGLDPKTRNEVWSILHTVKARSGMTIFLTTHYMEETENADEVVIIHHGKKICAGSPAQLKAQYSRDKLLVTPKDPAAFEAAVRSMDMQADKVADSYAVYPESPNHAIKILEDMRDNIDFFEMVRGSMDDVFLNAVGEKIHE
jgi:multidrug/hemolysin transport system ATP-binding protein